MQVLIAVGSGGVAGVLALALTGSDVCGMLVAACMAGFLATRR